MELVEAQRQGRRHTHIPYRDSRLTFLLQVSPQTAGSCATQLTVFSVLRKARCCMYLHSPPASHSMSGSLQRLPPHIPASGQPTESSNMDNFQHFIQFTVYKIHSTSCLTILLQVSPQKAATWTVLALYSISEFSDSLLGGIVGNISVTHN